MALQANCGQVRGPMQLTFARSVDRIAPQELAIVRVAVESTRMGEGHDGGDGEAPSYRGTMGRRSVVPYALYRGHGFYSPHSAKLTGFDDDDMSLFWEALAGAWELDRSSARGMMSFRGAYVFSHDNPLGNAPAHALFERITTARTQTGVESPPRAFSDYTVHARSEDMPNGVALATLGVE